MEEKNFLQWFGLKGGGLIPILFIMGAFMHWGAIAYPSGIVFMIFSGILAIVYIGIELDDKSRKSKRGY